MIPEILNLPAVDAAPRLLGYELIRITADGEVRLRIVETEAYHQDEPASHTFRGRTKRTAPMFETGGHLYVYFTYGMHYCLNIVTGQEGVGEAVLLRAAEPVAGIEVMKSYRKTDNTLNIASGPGKLAQALGIADIKLSGHKLGKKSLQLLPPENAIPTDEIIASPRIGISKAADLPWRFYIRGNPYVSKYQKAVHN